MEGKEEMKYRILGLLMAGILRGAFAGGIHAGEKQPLTASDIVNITEVADPQLSPDGKRVLFEIRKPAASGQPRSSDIWIVDVDKTDGPKPLVKSPHDEKFPRWSEDGTLTAYLSDDSANGIMQIFVKSFGEDDGTRQITFSPQPVVTFGWLHRTDRIAFISRRAVPTDRSSRSSPDRAESLKENREEDGFQHLYEIDLGTGVVEMISRPEEHVSSFDYSPGDEKVAYCSAAGPGLNEASYHSQLVIFDRGNRERRFLTGVAGDLIMSVDMGNIRWAPDAGRILHFTRFGRVYTMLPCLTDHAAVKDKSRVLAETYPGTIWEMDWIDDHSILVSSQEGTDGIIGVCDVTNGNVKKLISTGIEWGWPNNWSMDRSRQWIVFKKADVECAEDIWIMKTDGSQCRQLTNLNPQVKKWKLGSEELIKWISNDGMVIEGILIRPGGYEPGREYPLITIIHGGPEWSWWKGWHASWHQWGQLLASNGYAVLLPNPRGSSGYGWEFVEANFKDWGGGDFQDIMTGIDHVIHMGVADSTRLGICGWSYGGYLTAWAVSQSGRFKAAAAGAGPSDLVSFYDITPCPSVFDAYFGASVHDNRDLYERLSPVRYVENVETPLLILHGQNDPGVDVSQSQKLYNEMKKAGKTVELIVYPDEGHQFHQRDSQIDSLNRMLDWFDRYL